MRTFDMLLLALMGYFLLMNMTVERCYCHETVEACAQAGKLLGKETLDFCRLYNPLFIARPEWMRVATCISAYGFCVGYALIAVAASFNLWTSLRLPISLFTGMKLNAIFFYHVMEFTSTTPPPHLLPYFGVEGPYLLSIAMVIYRLSALSPNASSATGKAKISKAS